MNCKQTPSQPHDCQYWNGVKCCDVIKFVNRETGEEMCRFNSSAVHHSEYRETSGEAESASSATSNSDYITALKRVKSVINGRGDSTTKVLKCKDILCRLNFPKAENCT